MVVKLCVMASHGYLPGVAVPQDHGMNRPIQDYQPFWPSHGPRHEIMRVGSVNLRQQECTEAWKPLSGFFQPNPCVKIDSTVKLPLLTDVQDERSSSMLFGSVISEHCARREKISEMLMNGTGEQEGDGIDITLLSELMGLEAVRIASYQQPTPLIYPDAELFTQKPILDFVGELVGSSKITIHPDGRALFNGTGSEISDLLSLVAEFYLPKTSSEGKRYSMLIPEYSWVGSSKVGDLLDGSSFELQATIVAPLKSSEKVRTKSQKKKIGKKRVGERDLYKKNYFHACESLLSIMTDKRKNRKNAIVSLKKSGPELPDLLNQFSTSIAGTGLAVIFSVACRIACLGAPLCSSKILSTGLGFGLVWLSWAVIKLRDTIVYINKNPGKLGLKDEDMMKRVDTSVKEIYFRAATLMAVAVLRAGTVYAISSSWLMIRLGLKVMSYLGKKDFRFEMMQSLVV